MLALTDSPLRIAKTFEIVTVPSTTGSTVVCAAEGPRPRYPRVWKTKRKIGTIAKSEKLVECIKQLSNVKEEVYGALDSFVAWELEFPLLTVKKALKTLESEQDWKRIIQVTKWMISKGQGRTMGSYFTLFNALAEDGRLNEVEELWTTLLTQNLRNLPHRFFDKMMSVYHQRGMHEKMFEIFADMEELGVRPSILAVSMIGDVLKELGMQDKYELLQRKYPQPKWEYRYIKGKRVKIKVKRQDESNQDHEKIENHEDAEPNSNINKDDGSEKTYDINHERFKHDANVVCKEPEQSFI